MAVSISSGQTCNMVIHYGGAKAFKDSVEVRASSGSGSKAWDLASRVWVESLGSRISGNTEASISLIQTA